MGEHLPCKQGVESSNLFISIGSKICRNLYLENCIHEKILERNAEVTRELVTRRDRKKRDIDDSYHQIEEETRPCCLR